MQSVGVLGDWGSITGPTIFGPGSTDAASGPPALRPGAMTALGLLRLDAFAPAFAHWGMVTDLVDEADAGGPVR